MGLNDIKKKSESLGKASQKTFLKVNKYDDPKNAMELIGHICTAAKDIAYDDEFMPIFEHLFEMEDEREQKQFIWANNLFDNIVDVLKTLEHTYLDNTYQIKVAVSGGYSAGKSTFMNMLIGDKEFLPTDMNPTSLVNTYINFNSEISKPVVRGENIKNDLVLLDEDVLASIRHDTSNAKAIANVLRRLIIDIPSRNYLSGITFIDTPGYDNSLLVNRENGTTDKDTACKAFKDADVIFWCANIGKQITKDDLQFIKDNGGEDKPLVVLLSRMKSKASSEIPSIVDSCYSTASKELKSVLDVIAFDRDASLDEIYSKNKNSLSQLFEKIKKDREETIFDLCSFCIEDYFDEEMKLSKEWSEKYQKEYDEVLSKLNEARKNNSNLKDTNKDIIASLKEVIIDGYNEVMEAADDMCDSSAFAIDSFGSFYDGVMYFEKNDHWGTSSYLNKSLREGSENFDKALNKHKSISWQYYDEEYRQKVLDDVKWLADFGKEDVFDADYYEGRKSDISNHMSGEKLCQKSILKYKPLVLSALKDVNNVCIEKRKKHYRNLETLDNTTEKDIFAAISGNNMDRFILCFHSGVELSSCNSQGYNVLTWLATYGNTEMVEFLIKHKDDNSGVDLTITDKNGVSMLESAIIAHNKTVCDLLMKNIPALRISQERANKLASQNDFNTWICNSL